MLAILTSCASFSENESVYKTTRQQPGNKNLLLIPKHWVLKGKIAIISEEDNWHAGFQWSKQTLMQDSEQRKLVFSGPFGETQMELSQVKHGNTEFNRLAMNGEIYTDFSLQQLLSKQFGFEIPLPSLEHWIFGQTNPLIDFKVVTLSKSGQLLKIIQHDWKIQYTYKSLQSDFPIKVIAENKAYRIKVFIRNRA
ncbi:MAG: outer membrane lipoprotein LolB [Gammaproteobacteria bacterium]|nr:outer membrane lipoprotein LolB [Gammaproteobacteria bacterium]